MAGVMAELRPCRELDFSCAQCCASASSRCNRRLITAILMSSRGRQQDFLRVNSRSARRRGSSLRKIQLVAVGGGIMEEELCIAGARHDALANSHMPGTIPAGRRRATTDEQSEIVLMLPIIPCCGNIRAFGDRIPTMKPSVLVGFLIFGARLVRTEVQQGRVGWTSAASFHGPKSTNSPTSRRGDR